MHTQHQQTVIYIYNHTHWDREWYEPFEVYRVYLLDVVRHMLAELEAGHLHNFLLDGQAVVLEDIQELAPDLMMRLREQMQAGNVHAGPWYVLPDQMLVGGESLIRNLYWGRHVVEAYAPCLKVGYAPDTFGHSQDLPRILQGFGIDNAFVWRGVPHLEQGPVFCWQSPDRSCVITHLFTRGYYQTDLHSACAQQKIDREAAISSVITFFGEFLSDCGPQYLASPVFEQSHCFVDDNKQHCARYAVFPCGADHVGVCENQKALVESVNNVLHKTNAAFCLKNSSLADIAHSFAKAAKDLPLIEGELRDNSQSEEHTYAYLLPGVLSTRLYLKAANVRSEWQLFRLAEPFFSVLSILAMYRYPQTILERACKLLLKNQPHDSICGCSVDAVHREMLVRYDKIGQLIGTAFSGVENRLAVASGLHCLDPANDLSALFAFNGSMRAFNGVMPVTFLLAEDDWKKESLLNTPANLQIDTVVVRDHLFAGWGAIPYYKNVQEVRGWVWLTDVPALGAASVGLSETNSSNALPFPVVCSHSRSLTNGLVSAFFDEADNLVVRNLETGQERMLGHHFLDVGDGGDTYNFDPLLDDQAVKSRLLSVEPGLSGPLCASLVLTYEMLLPKGLVAAGGSIENVTIYSRSPEKITHHLRCEMFLKAGSRMIEFETTWLNESGDHRLSLEFNTGSPVSHSFSENHFSVVKRSHQGNRPVKLPVAVRREAPPDRFPSQRFFYANGILVLHEGLPEYGVRDSSLELTVLRSISILSRGRILSRGGGAGPHLDVPEAAQPGLNRVRYGVSVLAWSEVEPDSIAEASLISAYSLAERFFGVVHAMTLPRSYADSLGKSLITVNNEAIQLSAFYYSAAQNCFVLRMLNVTASAQLCTLTLDFPLLSISAANLNEEKQAADFSCSKMAGSLQTLLDINFSSNQLRTFLLEIE